MELTTALPAADEAIVTIPWDQLHDSPLQYRKTYSEAAINEIAATITDTGRIHQALVVRRRFPNPLFREQYDPQDGYEIVFGHTRKRAGILAGLAGAPCVIRDMNDAQVRAAQAAENIARSDVHPIEEAEGFQAMIAEDGINADELATQLGKSRSYVYGRLKLLQACPEIRKACLAGEIGSEVALLIARLRTPKLQEKALGYIKRDYSSNLSDGGKRSFRSIRSLLNEKFTLKLKAAFFDPEDATLCPNAGTCSACPKRSGNAPEFADVAEPGETKDRAGYRVDSVRNEGPDVCTDPDCFDEKKRAHLKRAAAALTAEGNTVVTGSAARSAVSEFGEIKGGYIAAKDATAMLKAAKVKWDTMPVVLIQDPRTGKTHRAVKRAELTAHGVNGAEQVQATQRGNSRNWEEERREREARGKATTERRLAVLQAVHAAALSAERSVEEHRILLDYILDQNEYGDGGLLHVARLWGHETEGSFVTAVKAMPPSHQALVMVELAMTFNLEDDGWDRHVEPTFLHAAAALYGIDPHAPLPTPSTAAQAPTEAAGKAKGKGKSADAGWSPEMLAAHARHAAGQDQTDDAGSAGGSTSTAAAPSTAARAPDGAATQRKAGKKGKADEQTDDAGSAGGSAGQVDAFAEAAS